MPSNCTWYLTIKVPYLVCENTPNRYLSFFLNKIHPTVSRHRIEIPISSLNRYSTPFCSNSRMQLINTLDWGTEVPISSTITRPLTSIWSEQNSTVEFHFGLSGAGKLTSIGLMMSLLQWRSGERIFRKQTLNPRGLEFATTCQLWCWTTFYVMWRKGSGEVWGALCSCSGSAIVSLHPPSASMESSIVCGSGAQVRASCRNLFVRGQR